MDISIVTCPQCNAMVLNDAARCHVCDHVLNAEHHEDDHRPTLPTDHAVAEDLETCGQCGETYRRGLVRCWNCGSFTRDEIKAAYDRMIRDPQRQGGTERGSETAAGEVRSPESTQRSGPWKVTAVTSVSSVTASTRNAAGEEELDATDDDFAFELADSVHLTDAIERQREAPEAESEGYSLAESFSQRAEIPTLPVESIPLAVEAEEESPGIPLIPSLEIPAAPAAAESQAPAADDPATAATPKRKQRSAAAEEAVEDGMSHSEATAGDVLLQIARQEEADISRSRKEFSQKSRGGFVVFCPMGCRIRVQDRHRGKAGKCPKCHSVFFVPRAKAKRAAETTVAAEQTVAPIVQAKWRGFQDDMHLHAVVPQKLRIKPDSLLNDFTLVDLALSAEGLLLSTLVSSPGFLGANLKKKPAIRTSLQEHLLKVGTAEGVPVADSRVIPVQQLGQLAVVQPSPADVESLFGNIPVFGTGRIAVRLPRTADDAPTPYLSFTLSEFREFVRNLEEVCGVGGLGADTEVPLSESYNTVPCHYSEAPVRELLGLEYYQKDPKFSLQVAGWRCGGCALVVSEDSRKKEKIGGLNGKSIASAKCPKCQAKFGSHPLYELAPAVAPEPAPAS